NFRIDEREKLIDDASTTNAICAEFDQSIRRCLGASRLDVNNDVIKIFEPPRMTVVYQQFDRVVDDFEASVFADEIGHEQTCKLVIDVRKFEDGVDNL